MRVITCQAIDPPIPRTHSLHFPTRHGTSMRTCSPAIKLLSLMSLLLLANAQAMAALLQEAGGKNDMPAGAQDMRATADAVGPENRAIAKLAGLWNVRQSIWSQPDAVPAIDHGAATFTPVLGGRHVRQELRIEAPDKPFEGLGYIGFDIAARNYYSSWRDTNFTGVIFAKGNYDAGYKTYTFTGEIAEPSGKIPLREVLRIVDDRHFTYEYYETRHGTESLAVRLEYSRAN